jgi:hypothetical protein
MNGKFVVAVVVMFVAWMIEGFVVHAWLLKPEYMKVASLYRPEAEQMPYLPWMLLAHLLIAFAFVWIYVRGKEAKPWLAQGLRYGFLVSLLATTPTYLIYYAVQPLPGDGHYRRLPLPGSSAGDRRGVKRRGPHSGLSRRRRRKTPRVTLLSRPEA